eukprot:scaffold37787_cov153-Skeletonema_marinoi.AAC.22
MKKSKAASTARMSRTTKQQLSQQPPPSSIMSNNENDVSFGNNVGSGEFIARCYCMIYFVLELELSSEAMTLASVTLYSCRCILIIYSLPLYNSLHSLTAPSIVSPQQQILHHQTMTITIITTLKNSSIC